MDNQNQMEGILEAVANGSMAVSEAMGLLKAQSFEDLGYAKVDFDRAARQGSQEVIYGAGKTPEQIVGIVRTMQARGCRNVLITRLDREAARQIAAQVPMTYYEIARIGVAMPAEHPSVGSIAIVTGGTSDLPVAEEAAITAELLGNRVTRVYDVGVAGLHRLLQNLEPLQSARVIVAVAGMEGALASVVGGLVSCPVIAVPTSVGYGANFGGLSALLSMLNSCASGVSVVNIDNGFGAGFLASRINQMEGLEK